MLNDHKECFKEYFLSTFDFAEKGMRSRENFWTEKNIEQVKIDGESNVVPGKKLLSEECLIGHSGNL